MKLVMGYTKRGDKMHLVNGDDLAVGLCGVKIDHHVRKLEKLNVPDGGELILWADHWRDGMTGSYDITCKRCLVLEEYLRRPALQLLT